MVHPMLNPGLWLALFCLGLCVTCRDRATRTFESIGSTERNPGWD